MSTYNTPNNKDPDSEDSFVSDTEIPLHKLKETGGDVEESDCYLEVTLADQNSCEILNDLKEEDKGLRIIPNHIINKMPTFVDNLRTLSGWFFVVVVPGKQLLEGRDTCTAKKIPSGVLTDVCLFSHSQPTLILTCVKPETKGTWQHNYNGVLAAEIEEVVVKKLHGKFSVAHGVVEDGMSKESFTRTIKKLVSAAQFTSSSNSLLMSPDRCIAVGNIIVTHFGGNQSPELALTTLKHDDVTSVREPLDQLSQRTWASRIIGLALSLGNSLEMTYTDDKTSCIWDVCVLDAANTAIVVMADSANNCVKVVYVKNETPHVMSLVLENAPWGIARLNNTRVAVAVPYVNKIVMINVTPDLVEQSTIKTDKSYVGLTSLDESTLVGGCANPPSLDILDTRGRVKKSIKPDGSILKYPFLLSTTQDGNILVSDHGSKCIVCLSPGGDVVFKYTREGTKGITSTTRGSVIVADWWNNKIIELSPKGKFVKDLSTSGDDIHLPRGVCFHKDKLYVTQDGRPLRVFAVN